jgi:predicted GTPase
VAIYHNSIKIISRGKGKSAVAAAACRAGQTITNEYDGVTRDYTRKFSEINRRFNGVRDNLNKVERRTKTLDKSPNEAFSALLMFPTLKHSPSFARTPSE